MYGHILTILSVMRLARLNISFALNFNLILPIDGSFTAVEVGEATCFG